MNTHWYALQSHPNKEIQLWKHLENSGFDVFFPRLRVNPVNPRARLIRPFFPGYLFIPLDLIQTSLSTFQYMPYATGLVSFGGEPAVVPDHIISVLKSRLAQTQEHCRQQRFFKQGDLVLITGGPFAGFEAIFEDHLSGTERVHLLLKMLSGQYAPLEIHANQVVKKLALSKK